MNTCGVHRQLYTPQKGACACVAPLRNRRAYLVITAAAKAKKQQQIVLVQNVPDLGPKGTLTHVSTGYFRNYLHPQKLAQPATAGILAQVQREKDAAEKEAQQVKAKAKAMAIALQTINKFRIKKKVGENDQIYGSVTAQEIVDAIEQQTGRQLDKRMITLPEIKTVGTFDATVKLHPEVVGDFKVVVQREKEQG